MARPKKAPAELRTALVHIRLTAAEQATVERSAYALGLTSAEFMRRRALGYRMPPMQAFTQAKAAAVAHLAAIGNNLNQLAKHANAGRSFAAATVMDTLARINAELDVLCGPDPE